MDNRAGRTGSNFAEIIIVLLVIVALNFLSYYYYERKDITESQQYTVSNATKEIMRGLDDPVFAELFLSNDLPTQLLTRRDEILDKLRELEVAGGGNLKLKVTDPGDDLEEQERATNLGVSEFEVQVREQDQASVQKVFMGLALTFEDRTESIPVLVDPSTLEYEVASRVVRMTLSRKPKIGFYSGFFRTNESQQPPSFSFMREILGGQEGLYEMVEINPDSDKMLPDDLDGLIICNAHNMGLSLKYSVDQFLLEGGQVFIAIDPSMDMSQQPGGLGQSYPSLPSVEQDLLDAYGITLDKRLIVEDPQSAAMASFSTGMFRVMRNYELWPQIGPSGFNDDVSMVAGLQQLVVPWCCPINIGEKEGVIYTSLAETTEDSWLLSSPFDLNPEQDWAFLRTTSEDEGPFSVLVMAEGRLPTAFPNGPPDPKAPAPDAEGEEAVGLDPEFDPNEQIMEGQGDGRIIVMSSANALTDNFFQQYNTNALFLINVVDTMLLDDKLMQIRSTAVTRRLLRNTNESQRSFYRWANVVGIPLLLILFGFFLWFLRNRRRQVLANRYGS